MKATFKNLSMLQMLAYMTKADLHDLGLIVQKNYVNHNITVESKYPHTIMSLIGVMADDGCDDLISVL